MLWPGTPQWYANVPSVEKVCRNESPCPSDPESNAAVFEVTVCVKGSAFVQQTVVPAVTCTDAGAKANPLIETIVSPA
jgi:hypothetical protein